MQSNAYFQFLERNLTNKEKSVFTKILDYSDASNCRQHENEEGKWPLTITEYYARMTSTPHIHQMSFKECLNVLDSDHGLFEKYLNTCSAQLGDHFSAKLPIYLYQAGHYKSAKQLLLKRQKMIEKVGKRERVVIMTFVLDEFCRKFPEVLCNPVEMGEKWEIMKELGENLEGNTDTKPRKQPRVVKPQSHHVFYVAKKKNREFIFDKYQLEVSTGLISELPVEVTKGKGPTFKPISLAFIPQISKLNFLQISKMQKEMFPHWNEWVSESEETIRQEKEYYGGEKQRRRKLFCINCSAPVALFFHFRKYQDHSTRSCFNCYNHKDDFVNHLIETVNSVLAKTYKLNVKTWEDEKKEEDCTYDASDISSSNNPGCSQEPSNQDRMSIKNAPIDFNFHLQDLLLPEDFDSQLDDLLLPEEFELLNNPHHQT